MPRRKEQFTNGEIYHITTRRIGDELFFKDINDYYRGIFSIYEFNNANPVEIRTIRKRKNGSRAAVFLERDKFVEVLAFCFMSNHIHLLLKQIKDKGISDFMQKFGSGYSSYFKERYHLQRKGYFYQGRFVAVHIASDEQLKTVFVYIHTNPVAFIEKEWKERGISNPDKVIKFLETYKWSSYLDYLGKKNFPLLTERNFLLEIMGGEKGCRSFVEEWVRYKGEIKEFAELALD